MLLRATIDQLNQIEVKSEANLITTTQFLNVQTRFMTDTLALCEMKTALIALTQNRLSPGLVWGREIARAIARVQEVINDRNLDLRLLITSPAQAYQKANYLTFERVRKYI